MVVGRCRDIAQEAGTVEPKNAGKVDWLPWCVTIKQLVNQTKKQT